MANIRIDLDHTPYDGENIVFKAPCNASEITGICIHYGDVSQTYTPCDAHGDNVGNINNLFAEGALVTIILDTDDNKAFVQNADTNAYLEERLDDKANKSETVSTTMSASNWQGTEAPYTYDFGISSDYDFEVHTTNTLTPEQLDAILAAKIVGNMTDNLFRAYGEKPTVNIPVIIRKWVK